MCNECTEGMAVRHDRRGFLGLGVLAAGMAALGAEPSFAAADAAAECAPFLAEAQAAASPDDAIRFLKDGNARFVAGQPLRCNLLADVKATAEKQTPFACVLACIDSRCAPELVFDQQIGDLFVGRVAGNVPTAELIGSFEYATKVAGAKAIVVLGHTHCGAIKGAVDRADVGPNLTTLLAEIEPAVAATPLTGERSSKNGPFVEGVAETNVRMATAALVERSPVLRELVESGAVKVVGAIYDIETGKARFL